MDDGRKKTTIREVAARAGVSVSTVSLALNSPDRVGADTRARVLAAADALDFVPKAEATLRARRAAKRVGVIGPFSSYPAAAERLAGILATPRGQALDIVVFDQPSASSSPAPLLASLPRSGRLDGVIVVSLPLDDAVAERARAIDLPLVLVDTRFPGVDSIRVDDEAGGRLAGAHLLQRGHRRFGFLGEAQRTARYTPPAQRRLDGYRAAIADGGGVVAEAHIVHTTRDLAAATAAAGTLLDHPDRPTAVFAADDLLAAAVLAAARERGLAVPGELAVVGYDDTELAQVLGLTTIRQPLRESGSRGLDLLRRRMTALGPVEESTLELHLVPRTST